MATDLIWYAWIVPVSPLFGKNKITTFERYFLSEQVLHVEKSNPYYRLKNEEWFSKKVLKAFGVEEKGLVVINGHTPVKVKKGESPIKVMELFLLLMVAYPKLISKQLELRAILYYIILLGFKLLRITRF